MDGIQAALDEATAKLQMSAEQIAVLNIQKQEYQKSIADLTNSNAVLTFQLQNSLNEKIRFQDHIKNYETQIVQQSLDLERLQLTSHQHEDRAALTEQLLQASRHTEQELSRKVSQLQMQLEMQLKHGRDLENRLEQSLTRWKADKELCSKETQRCAKLSATCASLIEKNERLELELKRYDSRLKQYDDLPMPVRRLLAVPAKFNRINLR